MRRLNHNQEENNRRYAIKVVGIVQGVGYRPYIYNQANKFNIRGWVSNQGSAVVMDVEGKKNKIKNFLLQIIKRPPSLARIEKVEVISKCCIGHHDFEIRPSSGDTNGLNFLSQDVAICPECLKEIFDPNNDRYHYAFTNCTACGPRYSIIRKLPYDRDNTTMDVFPMCPNCEKEYNAPSNRRFHAQTNCCKTCGPALSLLTNRGEEILCNNPLRKTITLLLAGMIVAIKGIGGFHLVCDGRNQEVITVLRERKNRPHKPFAIMVKDLETAKKLCLISEAEEKILISSKRPIVLLEKKANCDLPEQIAPNRKKLGIILPYTPLHYLLFQEGISCLIMTSGNLSNAPIQFENDQAIKNLGRIVDYFLVHNRNIHIPVEDSVVKVINKEEVVIRRARGYTPFIFPMKAKNEVLALGAEEKSTFSITQNGYGYMSQYLGDIKNYDSYIIYKKAIENLMSMMELKPRIIAHDFHTSYLSSGYARTQVGKKMAVQHHHAHMVSCMVEHHLLNPVIGVIYDGTGIGTDEKIWGGEFFVGTRENFIRVGHFKYVEIQGGDQAIREPWRIAVSYLHSIHYATSNILKGIDINSINTVKQALDKHLNCYETSSVGRLFDCVAAIVNLRHRITYEAQAAIELENILDPYVEEDYSYAIEEENGMYLIDYQSILLGILKDIENALAPSFISAKFHNTLGNVTIDMVCRISEKYEVKVIVLSGGVFENNYLLTYILKGLKEKEITVYYNQQIPTNDSGISIGQLGIVDAVEEMI